MRRTIVLFSLLSFGVSAAVKKPVDELARYRSEIMQMGARLSSLEKEITNKNDLYVTSLSQIKQFETDVKLYREVLKKKKNDLNKAQQENKSILQSYLLESDSEATELWQRKIHLELLRKAQDKLAQTESELTSFEKKVLEFDEKLLALRKNEEELGEVIKELENRKKTAMDSYLAKVDEKKRLEKVVQSQKLHTRIAKVKKQLSTAPIVVTKPDRYFARPVDDYLSFTPSPKGVTYKYQATQPVKAVGSGKIVFAGDLSNYGQVVLIDHGEEIRTVLLGKMNIRVKKNDLVNDGDILAYTVNDSKEAQNLYFEVRKKNTAQNTILWLDQNGVSKI